MKIVITGATVDRGAAAAWSLRRVGFEVYGIDARRAPRFMASRHLSGYTCIDDDDPQVRQDKMLRFIEQTGAEVFLPLCTPGAVMAVQRKGAVEALCQANTPSAPAFLAAYDKRICMDQCRDLGIPCAGSLSRSEAAAMLTDGSGRSVVVKPAIDIGAAVGLAHVRVASLLDAAIDTCRQAHGDCLVQEFIPGPDEALRTVTVVYGGSGRLVAGFTARKRRQWPPGGGVTALGVSTRETDLLDQVRPFFEHRPWRGPAEVELKHDERDGMTKVFEINPRLPGYLRHASLCELELAVVAARAALGEELPDATGLSTYREGVTYLAPTVFWKSVVHDARSRGWRRAVVRAGAEAAKAGPMLGSLLSDPVPIITRSIVPHRSCQAMNFRNWTPPYPPE